MAGAPGHTDASIPADSISGPGCYVCTWNGHILRIAESGPGVLPAVSIISDEALYVIKLSDNPYIPLSEARTLAKDLVPARRAVAAPTTSTRSTPTRSKRTPLRKTHTHAGRKIAAKRATRHGNRGTRRVQK